LAAVDDLRKIAASAACEPPRGATCEGEGLMPADPHQDYWKIGEMEQRFNATQSGVRALASTWMLAAFGAVAVLIRTEQGVTWFFHSQMLIVVVSTMACLGLFTLWIVDQIVFQRLLNSAFLVGLKLEHDVKTIPPIRSVMMYAAEGVGMSRWLRLFYFLPMVAFLVLSVWLTVFVEIAFASEAAQSAIVQNPRAYMLVLALLQIGLIAAMLFKAKDISISKRAALFQDPSFNKLFTPDGFRAGSIVEAYRAGQGGSADPAP
jgi:hypothetical protein